MRHSTLVPDPITELLQNEILMGEHNKELWRKPRLLALEKVEDECYEIREYRIAQNTT